MAKKSMIRKNELRLALSVKHGEKRAQLKATIMDRNAPMEDRWAAQVALAALPRNSAPVRYRNRCKLTGRPRGYEGRYGLSRICIRELINSGLVPGAKKSSW